MNKHFIEGIAALVLGAAALNALAHGDEPHGDEPHPPGTEAPAGPRFEAATEAFEIVGRLEDGALTLFINRFETNEPVARAKVELESGDRKATAAYRDDAGSYVVSEPKFVQALAQPGTHPMVVTVTAGDEADLLEATLNMTPPAGDAAPAERPVSVTAALAGTLGLGVLGAGVWVVRRRRAAAGAHA